VDRAVVLVVDDDEALLRLSATNLRAEGFTVVEAKSGDEAIARFVVDKPDAILLDVMMPQMNGFEACQAIRALPGGDMVAVAFFTAHGDSYDEALELAANDFIQKPVRRDHLIQRVRALVRTKRMAEALRAGDETGVEKQLALMRDLRATLSEPVAAILHASQAAQALIGDPTAAREHLDEIERRAADLQRLVRLLEKRIGG
jgi:DNA-binding response OmpR family regulator